MLPDSSLKVGYQGMVGVCGGRSFPVLPEWTPPPIENFRIYSYASHRHSGIGLRVAACQYAIGFLNTVDEKGSKRFWRTTCLETLGMLNTMLLAPDLLQGISMIHVMDNVASILAWASTLIRAAEHVCAYLDIDLHIEW